MSVGTGEEEGDFEDTEADGDELSQRETVEGEEGEQRDMFFPGAPRGGSVTTSSAFLSAEEDDDRLAEARVLGGVPQGYRDESVLRDGEPLAGVCRQVTRTRRTHVGIWKRRPSQWMGSSRGGSRRCWRQPRCGRGRRRSLSGASPWRRAPSCCSGPAAGGRTSRRSRFLWGVSGGCRPRGGEARAPAVPPQPHVPARPRPAAHHGAPALPREARVAPADELLRGGRGL